MNTELLIIGAGPFGLAMAAEAARRNISYRLVGEPMAFWKQAMPRGMILRSGLDWHLDPDDDATLERYVAEQGRTAEDVLPLALDFYLEYVEWFSARKRIQPEDSRVERLERRGDGLVAHLSDGGLIEARNVLLATGMGPFAHIPKELAALIPAGRSRHSIACAEPADYAGRRVLIVGGRQSAFECAALLAEAGATEVHVCHRHATPEFTESDWSWLIPLLGRVEQEPGWYHSLPADDKEKLNARFWSEGRLKLEPWLGPRIRRDEVIIHEKVNIARCDEDAGGLTVTLNNGRELLVDEVLYCTGFEVNISRLDYLERGGLTDSIDQDGGYPVLNEHMQSSIPGLYFTSLPASRDFGLFFAFTAAARASARIVGHALHTGRHH